MIPYTTQFALSAHRVPPDLDRRFWQLKRSPNCLYYDAEVSITSKIYFRTYQILGWDILHMVFIFWWWKEFFAARVDEQTMNRVSDMMFGTRFFSKFWNFFGKMCRGLYLGNYLYKFNIRIVYSGLNTLRLMCEL